MSRVKVSVLGGCLLVCQGLKYQFLEDVCCCVKG